MSRSTTALRAVPTWSSASRLVPAPPERAPGRLRSPGRRGAAAAVRALRPPSSRRRREPQPLGSPLSVMIRKLVKCPLAVPAPRLRVSPSGRGVAVTAAASSTRRCCHGRRSTALVAHVRVAQRRAEGLAAGAHTGEPAEVLAAVAKRREPARQAACEAAAGWARPRTR